ncbi:MAG: radical SAM protein [Spirochaetales bacterium]|nr:radical SAM protein [Spirochaetales bacterium]
MSHKRLANLLNEAKSVFREIKEEKAEEIIRQKLEEAAKDPMAPYKSLPWYPRYVVWELTLACNMRCAHCGSTAGVRREDELTLDQMYRCADELGELSCERLTLLGGEPLIHPHWPEVTKRLQQNKIRVNVITNGWTLTDERVCDKLKETGLTIVGISVDGMKRSHDKLRREGSFERIVRGMDLLKERGVSVAVCTVITSDSIRDLDGLYDLLIDKGVKVWQIQIASPLGRLEKDDPILIKPMQIKTLYDFFYKKRALKGPIHIDLADDVGYYPPWEEGYLRNTRNNGLLWMGCHAGIQVLGIDSNGNIKGCQSLPSTPEYLEGNIKEISLVTLWKNPDGFSYNRKFSMKQLSGYCAECTYGPICKAGCSSCAIAFTGNIGDNPMCIHRALQEAR